MNDRRRLEFLLFLCVFCSANLYGTSSWQVFSVGNGLPGNDVKALAICRSKMAVGTDKGVAVFDGENCVWKIPPLPADIASAEVRDLAFDKHQNLWIATPNGVGVLQKKSVEWFTTAQGLPTVDSERLQVKGESIFVGSFGGFVSKAFTPLSGKSAFTPVNYKLNTSENETLRLKSIGISGLAMRDSSAGWISTKGGGLILSQGLSQFVLDRNSGLAGDWIEAFWIFPGKQNSEHILVATTNGITLIRDLAPVGQVAVPVKSESTWISSLVTVRHPDEEEPRKNFNSDWDLKTFLGNRSLWVGTKTEGLFRYEKGKWTNYRPENSMLPSRTINRLYFHMGRILACTTEGLVVIPLAANTFDEFKFLGLGQKNFKTIFPHQDPTPVNFIAKKSDFWVATAEGLSRFIPPLGVGNPVLENAGNLSASQEDPETVTPIDEEPPLLKKAGGEARWERFSTKRENLFSDRITSMVSDTNAYTWMIFDNRFLGRVRVVPLSKPGKKKHLRKEKYVWDIFAQDQVPWRIGTKLNVVSFIDGKIYVGTATDGFYMLKNPTGVTGIGEKKFVWRHFDRRKGLFWENVIGFASQVVAGEEPRLAILHPTRLTLWDKNSFYPVSLDAVRDYACIAGDAQGNLWLGSDGGGVIRLTPDLKILNYSSGNAFFESNRITAIIATSEPISGAGISVWVACDKEHGNLDQLPVFNAKGLGQEPDTDGASLHFFDGLTWDKWKAPGIRCLLGDGDYLWLGTNIRLRRFYLPVFLDN